MARDRGNRDHYDRPSWSERDKMRGKKTSGPSGPSPERPVDRYKQKVKDEKFESLFSDPKKEAALKKIRENIGKPGFEAAVTEYHAAFGLPDDFDALQLILENCTDAALRTEALLKMDTLVDGTAASTQQVFKTRVKLLGMTSRELPLKKAAAKIAKTRGY